MTRETKVGLLVGICVILLIGIIISDQLTVMQQPGPAQMTDFAAGAQESLAPTGQDGGLSGLTIPPQAVRQASVPLPEELVQPAAAPQAPTPPQPPVSDRTLFVDMATNQPVTVDGQGQFQPADPTRVPTIMLGRNDTPRDPATQANQAVALATRDTQGRTAQPLFHDVQTGETLYQIAQRYYGNGEQWKVIREANADKVDAKGNVKLGVRLTIPNKTVVAPTVVATAQQPAATPAPSQPVQAMPAAMRTTPASVRVVVVEKGQTLAELARVHLGSRNRWPDLLAANRDQIRTPQELKPGMKLRLPAQTSSAPSTASTASSILAAAPTAASTTPSRETLALASRPAQTPAVTSATPSAAPATPAATPTAAAASSAKYTVVQGDTLSTIAAKTLGSPNLYNKIFEANRDQLRDADSISEGMVLKVPQR